MWRHTRWLAFSACASGLLVGGLLALAQAPGPVRLPPGSGERLEHLLTVRCGGTPITDERARKFVRVVDPEGRGVMKNSISIWDDSPKAPESFLTDRFGAAEVKANWGTVLDIHAGLVTVRLTGGAVRFPVEAVTSAISDTDLGEKRVAPWGDQRLRPLLEVRTGSATGESARKVVRVLDQAGRRVKGVKVSAGYFSSKRLDSYETDQSGVAELTKGAGEALVIDTPPVNLTLFKSTMKFPIEVVVSTDRRQP